MTALPAAVETAVNSYLKLVDETLPGEVLGLYLTGSAPLGDFQDRASDIDAAVLVASALIDPERVRAVHEAMPKEPSFDATYLTVDELALPPDPSRTVVFYQTGELLTRSGGPSPQSSGPSSPASRSRSAKCPASLSTTTTRP